jgi:hypothetical protein
MRLTPFAADQVEQAQRVDPSARSSDASAAHLTGDLEETRDRCFMPAMWWADRS